MTLKATLRSFALALTISISDVGALAFMRGSKPLRRRLRGTPFTVRPLSRLISNDPFQLRLSYKIAYRGAMSRSFRFVPTIASNALATILSSLNLLRLVGLVLPRVILFRLHAKLVFTLNRFYFYSGFTRNLFARESGLHAKAVFIFIPISRELRFRFYSDFVRNPLSYLFQLRGYLCFAVFRASRLSTHSAERRERQACERQASERQAVSVELPAPIAEPSSARASTALRQSPGSQSGEPSARWVNIYNDQYIRRQVFSAGNARKSGVFYLHADRRMLFTNSCQQLSLATKCVFTRESDALGSKRKEKATSRLSTPQFLATRF
jgi:hypothetical protein